MRFSSLASFGLAASLLTLGACGGSSGGTGTAGSSGSAGSNGSAGSGTAGASSGSAGSGTAGAMATAGASGSAGAFGTAGAVGSAGMTGTAGVSGAAGVVGTAGASGMAGATGTAGAPSGMSMGCGKANTDSSTMWITHNTSVTVAAAYAANFSNRIYYTKRPAGYDESKSYDMIIWGQGCGQQGGPEGVPPSLNPEASANSIIVQLQAVAANTYCASAGPNGDNADSPEIPYFDKIVSEVEAEFCIDKSKIFVGGYSTGGWWTSLMACTRANVIRGVGWAAAGLQKNHAPCTGSVAALITRGIQDTNTPLDQTMAAVEDLRVRNGCAMTTQPWTPTWNAGEEKANTSFCVSYDGCKTGYPLIWCPTPGAHTDTTGDTLLTKNGLWKLWSTLPN